MSDARVDPEDKPEVSEVRPGDALDWEALATYLRGHTELQGDFTVKQFPNGSANLTYLLQFGSRRLVLRRPPFGQIAPGAHDMRREYKVLSRLWEGFPLAPQAFHLGTDHSVIGSDFILMEYRPGVVVWGAVPTSMRHLSDVGVRMGRAVVRALTQLHLLDPHECGLHDLGRSDGFVRRQVEGWAHRWQLVAREQGGGLMSEIATRLAGSVPKPQRVSILHNDYKLDNCQFRPGQPDNVNAVFDWDMATLGDPLIDVGTLLNYWPDPSDDPNNRPITPAGLETVGLPTRAEVREIYSRETGLELSRISWYEAFACFKTAVVMQQLYTRWERGETSDERMAERGHWVKPMACRSARMLGLST